MTSKKAGNAVNPDYGGANEWQAQDDMRILVEAEKIRKDPKRLAAAKACAKKQYDAMEHAGLTGKKHSKEPDADD